MRVVAGTARGIRLEAPPRRDTRPTADRVREATFNALGSLDAIEDASVLDLFAGSGAMGIEALSRGARHATFVERDGAAMATIERNLDAARLTERATLVRDDVGRFLARTSDRHDVAILDPPYAFDGWDELLAALPADLAVVESDRVIDPGPGWAVVRSRRYGTTVVGISRRLDPFEETSS